MTSIVGVDLGTSHTVAMLRRADGSTRALLFDGMPVLPSACWLDDDGNLRVGRDAERMAALRPERFEPNPKRRINDGVILLGEHEIPVQDVFTAILRLVADKAFESLGSIPPVILTHPATWGSLRCGVLGAAAKAAGFPGGRLVPEPVAAARYFTTVLGSKIRPGQSLIIFDCGAGTVDIAVLRRDAADFTVTSVGGLEDLGGVDLDHVLIERIGGVLSISRPELWQRLTTPVSLNDRRNRRLFWEDIRAAKEMLSRTTTAPVPVPGVDDTLHLTREELESLARPLFKRAIKEAVMVIQRAHIQPRDVAAVFLVGGATRTPLIAQELHKALGIAPTVLEQPELPVAEGALVPPPPAERESTRNPAVAVRRPAPPADPPAPRVSDPPMAVSPTAAPRSELEDQQISELPTVPADRAPAAEPLTPDEPSTPDKPLTADEPSKADKPLPLRTRLPSRRRASSPLSSAGINSPSTDPLGATRKPEPRAKLSPAVRRRVWTWTAIACTLIVAGAVGAFLLLRNPTNDYFYAMKSMPGIALPRDTDVSKPMFSAVFGDRVYAGYRVSGRFEVAGWSASSGERFMVARLNPARSWVKLAANRDGVMATTSADSTGGTVAHLVDHYGAGRELPLAQGEVIYRGPRNSAWRLVSYSQRRIVTLLGSGDVDADAAGKVAFSIPLPPGARFLGEDREGYAALQEANKNISIYSISGNSVVNSGTSANPNAPARDAVAFSTNGAESAEGVAGKRTFSDLVILGDDLNLSNYTRGIDSPVWTTAGGTGAMSISSCGPAGELICLVQEMSSSKLNLSSYDRRNGQVRWNSTLANDGFWRLAPLADGSVNLASYGAGTRFGSSVFFDPENGNSSSMVGRPESITDKNGKSAFVILSSDYVTESTKYARISGLVRPGGQPVDLGTLTGKVDSCSFSELFAVCVADRAVEVFKFSDGDL